jgi:LAO/AO transport system kinase
MKTKTSLTCQQMIKDMQTGDVRALAKLISLVENRQDGWKEIMKAVYPLAGKATVFGITGSPGAGKSTLTNEIARRCADKGYSLGIIAVDPTSPFSGGALLGDRLRMRDINELPGIFIRSMATRGMLGGLCQSARDITRILDAAGKDIVIIETVGVGQDEIEVVRASDFVMLVCFPGQGDGVQAIKAGTMEIADLFVVNKADRDGADEVMGEILAMLELGDRPTPATVIKTSAVTREGLDELTRSLEELVQDKVRRSRDRDLIHQEILMLLEREVSRIIREKLAVGSDLDRAIEEVLACVTDPYSAVDALLDKVLSRGKSKSHSTSRSSRNKSPTNFSGACLSGIPADIHCRKKE